MELEERVQNWFITNKTFKGKMKLIGVICDDLGIKTFPYKWAGRATYDWNNEVAKIISDFAKSGNLKVTVEGRAYRMTWSADK